MTGGLIQIVTYGSQDLYLTGTPEITFFKVVYRRHTNFSVESMEVEFDDFVDFNRESILTVPKIGDAIKNIYLQITLPKMELKRTPTGTGIVNNADKTNYDLAVTNYRKVTDFMEINIEAYRKGYETYLATNVTKAADVRDTITTYMSASSFEATIDAYTNLVGVTDADKSSMLTIANIYNGDSSSLKELIYAKMEEGLKSSTRIQKKYYDLVLTEKATYDDNKHPNLKFAWVDNIGHSIIDYVEVYIGGNKIDKHYGDWLNIWNELTKNYYMIGTYDAMIGNVSDLTTFDRTTKPEYILQIPLQFWFCRNNGLALPLISLEFHDIYFKVKFRKFLNCGYLEDTKLIYFSHLSEELYLDEVGSDEGLILKANMLIDYVYLDTKERRRFAQASHEYLIEQVQVREYNDVSIDKIAITLDFNHPCKEFIWVAQKTEYLENITGYTKCRWNNYSIATTNEGNIVKFVRIEFNGYERVIKLDGNYFNYVLPNKFHKNTPSDGINVYSFSLTPELHQPSGQCNMSRISKAKMYIDFDSTIFVSPPDAKRVLNFKIYAINYNILRFLGGMGGLAYSSG